MTSTDHALTIEFDGFGGPSLTLTCTAPSDALCHATYDCGCESWHSGGVADGAPWHAVADDFDSDVVAAVHTGRFVAECGYQDWLSAEGVDALSGKFTLPVRPEWERDVDGVLFNLGDQFEVSR